MQKYVNQLIDDIIKSIKSAPERIKTFKKFVPDYLSKEDQEMFGDVEQYLHGELLEIEYFLGIEQMYFPEVEKLNEKQTNELTDYLIKLWKAYNFEPIFPKNIPNRLKYIEMREYLKQQTTFSFNDVSQFEFCDYMPEECSFTEYCEEYEECKENWDNLDTEMGEGMSVEEFNKNLTNIDDIDLPF